MLRQALDAARTQEEEQLLVVQPLPGSASVGETDSLLPESNTQQSYAATNNTDNNSEDGESRSQTQSYDDDEEWEEAWRNRHQNGPAPVQVGLVEKIWQRVKGCFFLVLNVENLWDSPSASASSSERIVVPGKNHCVVLFWFFVLAASYASERSTFKLLVDRTGPFRLFTVEVITFSHALMVGMGMLISAIARKDFSMKPLGIPIVDVGLMALLDTIHILLVFLTGLHVPPTLTVILVQFTLPLTALLAQFVHPDGCMKRCCGGHPQSQHPPRPPPQPRHHSESKNGNGSTHSNGSNNSLQYEEVDYSEGRPLPGWGGLSLAHVLGSVMISMAVLLALCPAIYSILDPAFFVYADEIPIQTAYNTMLFVSSCIPAAASQLYKEHIFLQYKQPVQPDYINFILSVFQFCFASIMAPLVYTLQGLAATDDWPNLYPSTGFSTNFMEGFQCFLGNLDEDRASDGYDDAAECDFSIALVLLYSFSIIAVGVAVDKIVNAGATKVMYRGVSAGIIASVLCLYTYDMYIPRFSYGPAIDSLNLVCVLLLVVGSEVYHRVSLQDATFETVYLPIDDFYDDED